MQNSGKKSYSEVESTSSTHLDEPFLHESVRLGWVDGATEWHLFILRRLHGCDDGVGVEGELGDALEALFQVGLHPQWVFSL